ncbi:MAG: hypothetical protein ABL973_10250 [Micropepsaceae bacterium]
MRKTLLFVAAVAPLLLSACVSSKFEKDPMYDAGFGDGCSTGTARSQGAPPSNPVRDDKDWQSSEAYRAGWKAGYGSCSPNSRTDTSGTDRDQGGHY